MTLQINSTTDDARLVALCKKGNTSAFEALVNRHQKMMLNVAFRMTGSYDDACDVTQEAFISAWRRISDFRGEARFSTWLTAIVINLSKNRLQQLHTSGQREAYSLDAPMGKNGTAKVPEPPCHSPSALDRLEEAELRRALDNCMKKLPPEFREVLVLRDMHGLSYNDVGEVLGVKEGTIKSRLFRARDGIKDCLRSSGIGAQS